MSSKILSVDSSQIFCNCRVKHYPDGSTQVAAFSADILRRPGWEEQRRKGRRCCDDGEGSEAAAIERSKRRARAAVADLARSNDFKYFVTLTLDKTKVNRYDVKEVTKKLNSWLDNNVRRKGLKYILVAEKHKDGAIHFHGFVSDSLVAVDSGTLSMGAGKPRKPRSKAERQRWLDAGAHIVYNLPAWTLGFTTAIELYGDRRAAIGYVCKYITKAAEKVGGRWYYSGGDLRRPEVTYHNVDFDRILAESGQRPYLVEALNCYGVTWDRGEDFGADASNGSP